MAVFWFGWAKKLKNIFTKQQADQYYLQKNSNQAQTVAGPVNLRSPIELGTEIKAGYGGLNVKFIPEDNSTKTLQFYNNNATAQRRFNLLIPEPTQANNPATKNYVDNAINSIQVGRSIKSGNYIFKTESKNIGGGNTPTPYSAASGFSVSNLVSGKLYLVEVRYLSGTYERAPIFMEGGDTSNIYITYLDAVVMFQKDGNRGLTVYANKAINNLSISFKEVIITS